MNNNKNIIVDVDCTVADFVGAMMTALKDKRDRKELDLHWNWFEHNPKVEDIMSDGDFWLGLPLIDKAHESIELLREQRHKIVWVTRPSSKCFGWLDLRKQWLQRHFDYRGYREPVVATGDKWLVDADIMIDDYIPFVLEWEKHHPEGKGFLFASELNKHSHRRRYNWQEITSLLNYL